MKLQDANQSTCHAPGPVYVYFEAVNLGVFFDIYGQVLRKRRIKREKEGIVIELDGAPKA